MAYNNVTKRIIRKLEGIREEATKELNLWKESYQARRGYSRREHRPFYDIAGQYLPDNDRELILDIGAGEGHFAEHLNINNRFSNLYLLDANSSTVESLKNKFKNVILYKAPDKLPFENSTISYIHCSHIVEHLYFLELYSFLKEVDRVLNKGGILVISTPLLWAKFYNDLSHVRPYGPNIFIKYLCRGSKQSFTAPISKNYHVLKEVYRYTTVCSEEWGSEYMVIDFLIQFSKRFLNKLEIKKYTKNGYTLVLRKDMV